MSALIVLSTIFGPYSSAHHSFPGLIALAMSVPASGGVFLYAFDRRASPGLWRVFSWLFAVDSLGVVAFFVIRIGQVEGYHRPLAVATLMVCVVAYQYFTWLALHRLSKGLPGPSSQNAPRGERLARLITESSRTHPRSTKAVLWSLMVVILASIPFSLWHAISHGKGHRLVIPVIIGLFYGIRSYAPLQQARLGK